MRLLYFLAILLTAVTLIPAGAHLFEMGVKLQLTQDQYFIVQSVIAAGLCLGP